MSFISFSFLLLYLLALLLRWGIGGWRPPLIIALLLLSWVFYAWHVPQYIVLILISTLIDYLAARRLAAIPDDRLIQRRLVLLSSLLLNLGLLAYFKYAGWLVQTVNNAAAQLDLASQAWSLPDILLPIGISFYTFQSISYTIDVYRGKITAERSFLKVAFYIAFFPQLIAGPIVRASAFFYQLRRRRRFRLRVFGEGAYLILRGLFLKLVIADNLGLIVDQHWDQAANGLPSLTAFALLVFFSCQLFCDFAAYSDIARGLAYQLGIRLPVNFNAPFIACRFSEFWQRWHISLSQWMRDYLYIPLGGNRRSKLRVYLNLLIVMSISGLWHGANWTYLLWGLLHGIAAAVERLLGMHKERHWIWLLGWFFVVQLIWVFSMGLFRAKDLDEAINIIHNALFGLLMLVNSDWSQVVVSDLIVLGGWFTLPVWLLHGRVWLLERSGKPRSSIYERTIYAGTMLAAVLTLYTRQQPFIYFQF